MSTNTKTIKNNTPQQQPTHKPFSSDNFTPYHTSPLQEIMTYGYGATSTALIKTTHKRPNLDMYEGSYNANNF